MKMICSIVGRTHPCSEGDEYCSCRRDCRILIRKKIEKLHVKIERLMIKYQRTPQRENR
jgi:hypothetical protein